MSNDLRSRYTARHYSQFGARTSVDGVSIDCFSVVDAARGAREVSLFASLYQPLPGDNLQASITSKIDQSMGLGVAGLCVRILDGGTDLIELARGSGVCR